MCLTQWHVECDKVLERKHYCKHCKVIKREKSMEALFGGLIESEDDISADQQNTPNKLFQNQQQFTQITQK
jgi:hypothetical protein